MAEMKRGFTGAKMNSDVDARFVPAGDYVTATNISILDTDGGTSGLVHMMNGNIEVGTYNYTGTAKAIGVLKNDPTDKIYLCVVDSVNSYVLEYDGLTETINTILRDENSVLGWSSDDVITGIQIIEDSLGWVCEGKEPCVIKISDFKKGNTVGAHTQYEGRDFILGDITMIKYSPSTAPTMVTSASLRDGIVQTTVVSNFTILGGSSGALSDSKTPGTNVNISIPAGSAFVEGDKLLLTTDALDTDETAAEYEIILLVTSSLQSGSTIQADIVNIPVQVEDNQLVWKACLIEPDAIHELTFPRFAYRWKYKSKQYSTISPFTQHRIIFIYK